MHQADLSPRCRALSSTIHSNLGKIPKPKRRGVAMNSDEDDSLLKAKLEREQEGKDFLVFCLLFVRNFQSSWRWCRT